MRCLDEPCTCAANAGVCVLANFNVDRMKCDVIEGLALLINASILWASRLHASI